MDFGILRSQAQLKEDALAIWTAGVRAVHGYRLVTESLQVEGKWLSLPESDWRIDLSPFQRVFVFGAGKAATAMAAGVLTVLRSRPAKLPVEGWVQVPQATDFAQQPGNWRDWIDLRPVVGSPYPRPPELVVHPVRPAGSNWATPESVDCTQQLCRRLQQLGPRDLALFVLSGGASALLSWPSDDVPLEDKNRAVQCLAAAGATIEELNVIRGVVSRVKAGGLLKHCRAGRLVTLVLSDVLGDPLDSIGSGPTIEPTSKRWQRAAWGLEILNRYPQAAVQFPNSVRQALQRRVAERAGQDESLPPGPPTDCHVLGNTALAVDAAGVEAERRGYSHAMHVQPGGGRPGSATAGETADSPGLSVTADQVGQHLAQLLSTMNRQAGPDCLITGGEPVVHMRRPRPDSRGGRSQQLGMAALQQWTERVDRGFLSGEICLVSAGTDGEDGSTPVAGVCLSAGQWLAGESLGLDLRQYMDANDGFGYFRRAGGLILTGATDTNVCDLRVGVVSRVQPQPGRTDH